MDMIVAKGSVHTEYSSAEARNGTSIHFRATQPVLARGNFSECETLNPATEPAQIKECCGCDAPAPMDVKPLPPNSTNPPLQPWCDILPPPQRAFLELGSLVTSLSAPPFGTRRHFQFPHANRPSMHWYSVDTDEYKHGLTTPKTHIHEP